MGDNLSPHTGDGFTSPVTGAGGGAGRRTARREQRNMGRWDNEATQEDYEEVREAARELKARNVALQQQVRDYMAEAERRQQVG